LLDRLDGLELCAEAQAQSSATGKFREFVRLFERAFNERSKKSLIGPLSDFLAPNGQGFTESEVKNWIEMIRHPLTHAAQRGRYLVEADAFPFIQRVEQAAYDVLLNKAEWRKRSVTRRGLWTPEAGTADPTSGIFLTKGKGATIQFQPFDALGGFPADLSAALTTIPETWWPKLSRQDADPH
jgi:hypothetical protein